MSESHVLFDSSLRDALQRWELPITPSQAGRLRKHYEAVIESNRVMNLTRITEPIDAAVKHYADSLALLNWARERNDPIRTLLDVGTGAGFPAVPLAVMSPEWEVTAIDATRKKVDFLARTAATLGVDNLRVEQAHTAHWTTEQRFDVVAARALGPLARCMESCPRFVGTGGFLIVYKTGRLSLSELTNAEKLLKTTRMRAEEPFGYDLQLNRQTLPRALHVFRRVR